MLMCTYIHVRTDTVFMRIAAELLSNKDTDTETTYMHTYTRPNITEVYTHTYIHTYEILPKAPMSV